MFAFNNLAPKLLISEILDAAVVETESGPKLTSHGIYYNRVQIQGNLEGNPEQGYRVQDVTGAIPVILPASKATEGTAEQHFETDIPVIVIGSVFESDPSPEEEAEAATALEQSTPIHRPERFIEAKKLITFSQESNISEQWLLEVNELAMHVYPQMAAVAATASQQE